MDKWWIGFKPLMRRQIQYSSAGLGALEILITTAILVIISTIVITSFRNSRDVRDLATSTQNVMSTLKLAQSKALAGEDNSLWGARIENGRTVLFRGTDFATSTSTEEHLLPNTIEIVNINLAGGGQNVIFKKIDGSTDQSGSFDVRVRNNTNMVFSITIDSSGKVYQAGSIPPPAGTRRIDARHYSFNLGWSIQTAATTTLVFSNPPNPDTVVNTNMGPFFDAGRTKFDWSTIISINGEPQSLRIHTTSITAGNTVLSIDRDCRQNTKKVRISIDTKDIATYEADCQTVTVGAFGGTMFEP